MKHQTKNIFSSAYAAKVLNDHCSAHCAGFYAKGRRFFQAENRKGSLFVFDFEQWTELTEADTVTDHNGREVYLKAFVNGGSNLADAKALLKEVSMTLTKRDGEYRVNFKGAGEGPAYYTDDLFDAISTGLFMANRGNA